MLLNYIWTDRLDYVSKRKKTDKCFLCEVAKGRMAKKESLLLFENKSFLVMMNKYPYNTGHLLIAPKRHVEKLSEMTEKEKSEMMSLVDKSVKLVEKVFHPPGFNVGFNIGGPVSGGSIKHLHAHVVPRFNSDFGFLETTANTRVMVDPLKKTFRRLEKEKKILGQERN